jgi:hypothetical protein
MRRIQSRKADRTYFIENKQEESAMGSVISKWENALLMRQDEYVAPHIPITHRLSSDTLKHMLQFFPFVYLKPDNSCQGKGLMRIDRLESGHFALRVRDDGTRSVHASHASLLQAIHRKKMNRRHYVVQQGINSKTLGGRMFDIRTHLMRIDGRWVVVGIVARIAREKGFVTNAYSGGKSYHVFPLLVEKLGYGEMEARFLIDQMMRLSRRATKRISSVYPKWSEFGLDIGIDQEGHLWIYEINVHPGTLVFKNLGDAEHQHILEMRKRAG